MIMLWMALSISAAFIWAIVNTIDKYVLTNWVKKPIVLVMILGINGLLVTIFIYLFHGISQLSYSNIILAFIAGIFYILMSVFYFKAVKIEEISRVVPLFYLNPLFVLIFATIFLKEILTPIKYLGVIFLIIGAVLISSKNFIKFRIGKAFWFMMLSALALSISIVITKYLLNFADFWTIFSYISVGTIFALIPIFYFNFSDFVSAIKDNNKIVIMIIFLNELLNVIGVLLITIATQVGYVTLVNALSSTHSFFVLLFTVTLSIFYPKILKEKISKPTIMLKLIAILLMFIGTILIT